MEIGICRRLKLGRSERRGSKGPDCRGIDGSASAGVESGTSDGGRTKLRGSCVETIDNVMVIGMRGSSQGRWTR